MAKNILSVQLLRNTSLFANKQAAIEGITSASTQDGVIKLARYTEGEGTSATTKTIFGIYNDGTIGTAGYTIYDSYQEVIAAMQDQIADLESGSTEIMDILGDGVSTANTVTDQLEALSGSTADTSATTSVEGAKAYTDDKISTLDYNGVTTGDAVVITNVTEADGVVSATSANVGNLKLDGYVSGSTSGAVAATDTINEAFGKVENQIAAINNVVEDLDYSGVTTGTGIYVTNVTEENGKISATTASLPTVAAISETGKPITAVSESLGEISATAGTIEAQYVDVTDSGNLFSATTVETVLAEIDAAYKAADTALKNEILGDASESGNTLGELEDRIEELEVGAKEYHIVKTTTGLPEEIKERYSLVDAAGNVSGDTIDIPKDSHIVSIDYIDDPSDPNYQKLEYIYMNDSGTTSVTYVDMSELVLEAEFDSGVTATNGVVHGVVDSTSEKDSQSTPADFLTVGAGGFKVSGIKDEIDRKIAALDNTSDAAVAGQYITYITETDGIVSVGGRDDIADAPLNGYTKGSDASGVTATDTINEAISKLENQIDAAEEAAAAAATVVELKTGTTHVTLSSTTDSTTSAVTYIIGEDDIASADDLAELSAKTVTEIDSSNSSITVSTAATTAADGTVKYDVITDASKIKMSGFTPVDTASSLSNIAVSSSVTEAFQEVDRVITENEQTVSAALNDLEETKVENINVNGVEGTFSNKVASVTIDGADIKLDGYASGSSSGAVVATDTVNQAIGKLENQVKAAVAGGLQQVEAGSGITVSAVADNKQTITAKLSSSTGLPTGIAENAIKFDSTDNGMYIEYIDAGTY